MLLTTVWLQESKISVGVRSIVSVVQKAEGGWWKRLLRGEGKAPHYVKVDWDKWADEDEDEGMYFCFFDFLMCKEGNVVY